MKWSVSLKKQNKKTSYWSQTFCPELYVHISTFFSLSSPQSLTFKEKMSSLKFKEKTTDLDTRSHKYLLLALVKLIHADPKLMLHVSKEVYLSLTSVWYL